MEVKDVLNQRDWFQAFSLYNVPYSRGVYLFQFPDLMRYVGSTKCLFDRINSHNYCITRINKHECKWYEYANRSLKWSEKYVAPPADVYDKELYNWYSRKMTNFDMIKESNIQVFYCECKDYAFYEDLILKTIKENNQQKNYYNKQFYSNNFKKNKEELIYELY